MVVVADTTPLNHLVLIEQIDLLRVLYQRVLIPQAVLRELHHSNAPLVVRKWVSALPEWCEVRDLVSTPDALLNLLDAGERDAIQLALDNGLNILLLDEIKGRREAQRRGLRVTGTLSILETAAQLGLIDFRFALQCLEETKFRVSVRLRDEFLRRNP